jgi:hypothetical protein
MTKRRDRGKRNRKASRREGGEKVGRGRGAPPGRQGESLPESLDRVPGWSAPLVYLVVTLLLFREFLFSDLMLLGQDTLVLGYVARAFFADALATTGFPLWNPHFLGGTPFLDSLAGGDSLYPPSLLLLFLFDTYRALGWKLILHVFLAGCFMYGWLRAVGASRGASLLGGLAWLLTPYMVSLVYPGHDGKIFVTALAPLLFWTAERCAARVSLPALAGLGGTVALILLTTHFQMAYFLFGAVGAYMIFRAAQAAREGEGWGGPGRRFALFLVFSVVGAGTAGVQLIPAVAYVTEHSRRAHTSVDAAAQEGRAWASSWSIHPEEAVGLVIPEFVGSDVGGAAWSSGTYWGRNLFKHNHEYLGLVILLLAGISFLGGARTGLQWFLVGVGAVAFLFALGTHTPVWGVAYAMIPGISLFRAPSMILFLTSFAAVTLAALGVDRGATLVARGEEERIRRFLAVAAGGLALGWVLALTGILQGAWTALFYSDITDEARRSLEVARPFIARGFLLGGLVTAVTLGVWWGAAQGYVKGGALVGLLGVLVAADQVRVNDSFIQYVDYHRFFTPDGNHRFLIERAREEEPFRVFSLVQQGQDVAPALFGLDLAGGHHPNDLGRYRELIGMVGSGMPEHLARFNPNVLDILNVRYILWPDFQYGRLEGATPVNQIAFPDGQVYASVFRYPALPRARLVGQALVVPEHRALETILDPEAYNPRQEVVLTREPPIALEGPLDQGDVRWIERTPNRLVLEVDTPGPALLVLSENWFPAWRATVGGERAEVLRADHTLRAVAVPAGTHRVEMWFESRLIRGSLFLSLGCLLVLGGTGGAGVVLARKGGAARGREGDSRDEIGKET